jgi:hypothetical protein
MSADKNTLFVRVKSEEATPNSKKIIILDNPKARDENHSEGTCPRKENCLCALLKEHLTNEMFSSIIHVFNTPCLMLKIFLVIFNLLAVGLASYTTIKLILSYLEYGVTSTTRGVYKTPAVFPKVTICNVNPFTSKYGYEFFRNITNNTFDRFPENQSSFETLTQAFISQVKAFALASNLSDLAKKSLSKDIKDSLLRCGFNVDQCTSDDFSWFYDLVYGNCYSFNSGFNSTGQQRDSYASYLAGNFHGLIVDFYVRSYENISLYNSIWGGTGAIIRIDNVSHVIDHIKDGVFVSPGTSTYISVNREYKTILPKPYSDCEIDSYDKSTNFDSDLYKLIKNSMYDYTQSFCLEQCLNRLQFEMCGCQTSFFKTVISPKICFSDNDFYCAINAYYNVYLKNNYIQNVCMPQCPLECYSNKFTFSTSSYDVNGDMYVNTIKNNPNLASDFVTEKINAETVRTSFVRINVFYETLSYTMTEETPQWDIFSLVANMGGNLGLFLGVSFFSTCEIITTLFELYFYANGKNKILDICQTKDKFKSIFHF